jgi:peroxiredoxin
MVFIPDEINYPDIEMEACGTELELLEKNYSDFHEIEKWSSKESFDLMADFAEQLTENSDLQQRLIHALNNRKPFRNFKHIIENSGEYRLQWFAFKNKRQQEYVEKKLNDLNSH